MASKTHDSGDTGSFVDEDGMMSCTNSWAIKCCDENLTETSAAVPHTWRWESDMPHELKTAQKLVEIVSKALDANADTTGWSPTGIQEHAEDSEGCNWNINYLHGDSQDEDVKEIVMAAAEDIINGLRKLYNLQ